MIEITNVKECSKSPSGVYVDEMGIVDIRTAFRYQGIIELSDGTRHIMGYSDSKEWFDQEIEKSVILKSWDVDVEVIDNPLYIEGDKERIKDEMIAIYKKLF